jgi:MtN3 and saliva related transmembrane protein
MCDVDNDIVNIMGYSGGIILSVCLFPQILKIIKTKEVKNISYIWQLMYIIGLCLNFVYSFHYNLLPIYIPCIIELLFIVFLTFLKFIYSNYPQTKIITDV